MSAFLTVQEVCEGRRACCCFTLEQNGAGRWGACEKRESVVLIADPMFLAICSTFDVSAKGSLIKRFF